MSQQVRKILCIDPGPVSSGVVVFDGTTVLESCPEYDNEDLLESICFNDCSAHKMVIEMIACYGMPVGKETFETCVWIGRFIERFGRPYDLIYRKDVKLTLCNNMRAKDANIRQAILDRFSATGGGKTPQIGTKNKPGPLYGISKHAWSALALGLTWFEQNKNIDS